MSEENKTLRLNPRDYFYKEDTKIEIPGGFLTELIAFTDQLLEKEVKSESEFKYNYINDKDKVIKTFKQEDFESGKVRKVVDWERTVYNPTFKVSLTEKGVKYAKLKNFLEELHMSNIEKGLAVTHVKSV